MWLSIFAILISSGLIYYAGEHFASASSKVGDYIGLSKSAKGATLDAISSSLPELMVSLFGIVIFHKFEVGVGTIVGSALFNILIIPAICVFLAPVAFKVSEEVIHRDGLFYNLTIITLTPSSLGYMFSHSGPFWLFIAVYGRSATVNYLYFYSL